MDKTTTTLHQNAPQGCDLSSVKLKSRLPIPLILKTLENMYSLRLRSEVLSNTPFEAVASTLTSDRLYFFCLERKPTGMPTGKRVKYLMGAKEKNFNGVLPSSLKPIFRPYPIIKTLSLRRQLKYGVIQIIIN